MSERRFPTGQWAEWGRDFESIKNSLVSLGEKRAIHLAHREVLSRYQGEDDGTGVVHRWMQENYAESMLMGLRRVIDKGHSSSKTFSLITLLKDIKRNASEVTFEKYIELGRHAQATSNATNDSDLEFLYAKFSSDGRNLDSEIIKNDIDNLHRSHEAIRAYIDTVIAHREKDVNGLRSGASSGVTWEDLDRLFDDTCALFNKYYLLVNPGVYLDFEPVLPSGFEQAFRRMVLPTIVPPVLEKRAQPKRELRPLSLSPEQLAAELKRTGLTEEEYRAYYGYPRL